MKIYLVSLLITFLAFAVSDNKNRIVESDIQSGLVDLHIEKNKETSIHNQSQITTFLTFQNNDAEEAMNFYVGLFDNSGITDIQRYGKDGPAKEGSIMVARFELDGAQFACSDSYIKHAWDFTPGVSIWIECKSEDELMSLFSTLSGNGKVLMPLANYGFSKQFGFVEDQFGVSWQLNLN